jgi:TatD DNase family protein
VPFRGKRNEPAWVVQVAETLAAVRGSSTQTIEALTTANLLRLCREE